jgi:hypothetical protein
MASLTAPMVALWDEYLLVIIPISIAARHGDNLSHWASVLPDRYFMAFQSIGVERGRSGVSGVVPYSTRLGQGGEIYAFKAAKP